MMNIKNLSMIVVFLAASLISSCDQVNFYDFAKKSGIGRDEKTFSSFSINDIGGEIDNTTLTITVYIPNGTDVSAPATRFTIRGDHVEANAVEIDSGTTSINYSTGTASLTVFAMDGTSQAYSVTINFTSDVAVTGISFTTENYTLYTGDTLQLSPVFTPSDASNRGVTWSCNASAIASVSNTGLVTGNGAGSAVITATTDDGGYSAQCNITVSSRTLSSISLIIAGTQISPNGFSMASGSAQDVTVQANYSDGSSGTVNITDCTFDTSAVTPAGFVSIAASADQTFFTITASSACTGNITVSYYNGDTTRTFTFFLTVTSI